MLKDITLGQFFPVDSVVHKVDARVKIILTFIYIMVIFFVRNFFQYAVLSVFVMLVIKFSKVPVSFFVKSLKPLVFLMSITAFINLFTTSGTPLFTVFNWLVVTREGLYYSAFMIIRLIFLVTGSSILTYTTSPIMLTNAIECLLRPLEKLKFPAHEVAMMMTISLRFIPTLIEETDKIIKSQMSRGSDFESGNIFGKAKAMVPVFVPLFISAFRRADELAVAMESRCYNGGAGRTSLNQIDIKRSDIYIFVSVISVYVFIFLLRFLSI